MSLLKASSGHSLKVAGYIFISGGLTAIISQIGELELQASTAVIVTGIINIVIAALKRYIDLKKAK